MNNCPDYISGSFDRCHDCIYMGNGCSGPRTTAMSFDRWVWWIKLLKQKRGYSNADCVEGTGLSKGTIDNIFSGKLKDVSRSTAGLLEDFLIGGAAKWPCAMDLNKDKEVVYEDRPETLEALRVRSEQVENLRRHLDEFKAIMDKEVATVRGEYESDVQFYKEHIAMMREQIKRKDDYIDRLAKKAGI